MGAPPIHNHNSNWIFIDAEDDEEEIVDEQRFKEILNIVRSEPGKYSLSNPETFTELNGTYRRNKLHTNLSYSDQALSLSVLVLQTISSCGLNFCLGAGQPILSSLMTGKDIYYFKVKAKVS